jgi:hypothetical protein
VDSDPSLEYLRRLRTRSLVRNVLTPHPIAIDADDNGRGVPMDMETIRLRRAALGCVLEALPKWRKTGVRIANHALRVNGEHREWLTIFRGDGSLVLWEHFPRSRMIGKIPAVDVGRSDKVDMRLAQRLNALFT